MEDIMEVPQKTKSGITVWSSNLTPGIHPNETVIQKDTCAPMFIAAYSQQSKYGNTLMPVNRWVDKKDVVSIHNGILLSHKRNEIMLFAATWTQLRIIKLSEGKKRKTNNICYHLYVESKIYRNEPIVQNTETASQRTNLLTGSGRGEREAGVSRCKLLYIEWINYCLTV